jgi:hypothetical protein
VLSWRRARENMDQSAKSQEWSSLRKTEPSRKPVIPSDLTQACHSERSEESRPGPSAVILSEAKNLALAP